MRPVELDRIVCGYLESFRQTRDDVDNTCDGQSWDGYRKLEDIFLESKSSRRVEILDRLASACVTSEETAFIGSGPVEDFIVLATDPIDIDALATAASKNPALQQALKHVWVSEEDLQLSIAEKVRLKFPSLLK